MSDPAQPPIAPHAEGFAEPWQAQVMAMADAMIAAGSFSATQWAQALGAALRRAEATGAPDDLTTYYTCALTALEELCARQPGLDHAAQAARKEEWRQAYLSTPHGAPVRLRKSATPSD